MSDRLHPLAIEMPRSDEAEHGIISCLMVEPVGVVDDARTTIPEECFYHAGHRLLFTEMLVAHSKGVPLDLQSLTQWLTDRKTLDRVGGVGFLADRFGFYPTPVHYPHFRSILIQKLKLRRIITICQEGIALAYETGENDANDCLAQVATRIIELEQEGAQKFRTMPELVQAALARYEEAARRGGQLPGISTGHDRLDAATGGLMKSDVWVVGGGTSDGKSAFVEGVGHAAIKGNHPTAIYTFEMSDDKTTDRYFCIDSQVSNNKFKRGLFSNEDSSKLRRCAERLMEYPLYVRDVSGMKLSALMADMRLLKRKHGVEVFIIDYGQLVRPDKKGHTRESEVAEMSATLKAAAKSLKATVIVLSQLNDDGKLRESRAIGMDADIVLTISVPEKEDEATDEKDETRRILYLGKNRDGVRGETINFRFDGPTFTFTEERNDTPAAAG